MLEKSIALIGMPGSGKSSVGRALARILGLEYIDTDSLAEKNAGMTVGEIFARLGEERFREFETQALLDAAKMRAVISCGGGIVTRKENREILSRSACAVYLAASLESLCARVGDGSTRPLLAGGVKSKLAELMRVRAPLYESAACITVSTDGLGVDAVAAKAAALIKDNFETNGGKR